MVKPQSLQAVGPDKVIATVGINIKYTDYYTWLGVLIQKLDSNESVPGLEPPVDFRLCLHDQEPCGNTLIILPPLDRVGLIYYLTMVERALHDWHYPNPNIVKEMQVFLEGAPNG